jgi:hypothetical protein
MLKKIREDGLDKFYTDTKYAKKCIEKVLNLYDNIDFIIEPSAGNGSFYNQLPNNIQKIGLDIHPENENILKEDFFNFNLNEKYSKVLCIGNPPFGKSCSLAVKFFNHASNFSDIIAFIVPRTFKRISIQNKLNLNFHLKYSEDIPLSPCHFFPKMNVKCCFQIWEKSIIKRNIINYPEYHKDFDFLKYGEKDKNNQPTVPLNADFALRAYGGKIGEIIENNICNLRPKSFHFIKSNIDKSILIDRFNKLDFSISNDSARQNSLGKKELVNLYISFFDTE